MQLPSNWEIHTMRTGARVLLLGLATAASVGLALPASAATADTWSWGTATRITGSCSAWDGIWAQGG
ncbi:hypothetical protein HNP84_002313 [Thermocatellispora tengchongensis]|uniref:Chitinase n=1 Tax=Thermocatellispora tengchongensis TaxID=1073253 RepID=A0A840P5U8_9ACTN|nr:hypothetical protein [Thermocatellispora tengchongensis]MBB5132597.1 hypothetical protein [Thermocatellispora tengchongensis]